MLLINHLKTPKIKTLCLSKHSKTLKININTRTSNMTEEKEQKQGECSCDDSLKKEAVVDEKTLLLIKRLETYIKIDEDDDVEDIKKSLLNKAKQFSSIVDEIINPDTSIKSMHESNSFDDGEKNELYDVYKKMQYIISYYNQTELKINDDDNLEFLESWLTTWEYVLPILEKTLKKIKKIWEEKDKTIKLDIGYLG